MKKNEEKVYRLRIRESEKAHIERVLAKDLKRQLQDFMAKNEKPINSYNKGVYQWEQRRKIRELIHGNNGSIIAEIQKSYYLLQRLTFEGPGRPYVRTPDLISEWDQQKIFSDCNEVLET